MEHDLTNGWFLLTYSDGSIQIYNGSRQFDLNTQQVLRLKELLAL